MFPSICQRILFLSTLFPVILGFGGCASYQLGSGGELPFKTIFVRPATNDSFAPQAQALVSAQVRETIIQDGRLEIVANESDADAVLMINLSEYDRSSAARSSEDSVEARDFNVTLVAEISLYDNASGDFQFRNREVSDYTIAYVNNPYADQNAAIQSYRRSEYQAMPRLARDLGRKIADEVLSVW